MKNKIMVVEDNSQIRELYQRVIEANGFSAVEILDFTPDSVEKAFLFYKDEILCVISDYNISDEFTGADVVKIIRGLDSTVPIFAICSDETDGQKMMALGANRFFPKPFSILDFIKAVNNLTAGQ